MNESSAQPALRERLPFAPRHERHFHWRGQGVSRLEGLTDAVFAFTVTLLVVSLDVPTTFTGLLDVLRGFPAFVICFAIIMTFWNAHFRYHRRYGFEDTYTLVVTMCILVLVLFFVYPLKFLFTLVTMQFFDLGNADTPRLQGLGEVKSLYLIYGLGFAGVWSLYAALYAHALRCHEALALSDIERVQTRASLIENLIYVVVCVLSIALALTTNSTAAPGFIYFAIGPLHAVNGWWFGRKVRRLEREDSTTEVPTRKPESDQ